MSNFSAIEVFIVTTFASGCSKSIFIEFIYCGFFYYLKK